MAGPGKREARDAASRGGQEGGGTSIGGRWPAARGMLRARPHLSVPRRHPGPGQEGEQGAGHQDDGGVDAGKLRGQRGEGAGWLGGPAPVAPPEALPPQRPNWPPPPLEAQLAGRLLQQAVALGLANHYPDPGNPRGGWPQGCMPTLVTAASAGLCWLAACSTSCAMRATAVSPAAAEVRTSSGVEPTLRVPACTASPGRRSTGADSPAPAGGGGGGGGWRDGREAGRTLGARAWLGGRELPASCLRCSNRSCIPGHGLVGL